MNLLMMVLELSKLEKAKLLVDTVKVIVDGWAIVDERLKQKKDEKIKNLENRIVELEKNSKGNNS